MEVTHENLQVLVGEAAVKAFEQAGEFFNFRCPITGEYKVGTNWAECH